MSETIESILGTVSPGEIESLTCDLIAIETHEAAAEREKPGAAYIKDYMERRGVPAELIPVVDGRPNVIARVSGSGGGPVLLLNGHTDTVPAYAMKDAFKARIEGDRIPGRGSVDMKGALAAMMCALVALTRSRASFPGDIVFAATIGEEETSEGASHLVSSALRADYAIVGEPTGLNVGIAHKGTVRGEAVFGGRAAHSSIPVQGVNAIHNASAWIERIGSEYIPSLTRRSHALLGSPTMNLGIIAGGTRMSSVPDRCTIRFDRRTIPGEEPDGVIRELQTIADEIAAEAPEFRATVEELPEYVVGPHPPLESDPNSLLVEALLSAREKELGERTAPVGLTYWTDAALLAGIPGIQAVVCGPGSIEQAHTNDEWVPRHQLHAACRMYLRAAATLCMQRAS